MPRAQAGVTARQEDRLRILLLEDDPGVVDLLRHYLVRATWVQHTLAVAGTLQEALAQLRQHSFDLAIVDLNLPDSSGIATLEALSGSTEPQIIVVTGDDTPGLREAVIARGAYEFLHKEQLGEEALHRLVRLARLHSSNVRSLRESEERFRSLTVLSSDMYWEQDDQYRFTSVSDRSPPWLRAGVTGLLGKRRWDMQHFNMSEADWAAHRAALDARKPFSELELGRYNDAGEEVWVTTSGEPVFDQAGVFKGYRGVGKDITARKRAERALRESEERFRSLTALSADWYWEQDHEFRLTFMSSTLGERTGLRGQHYLGRRRWDHPALNLTEEDWTRHRDQLARHEPFRDFEMQRPVDGGGSVWLSISGEPIFDKEGHFTGYLGVGRDITERKREERLLRLEQSITRSLADAEVDDGGAIRTVLRAICESEGWKCGRFFGYDERSKLMRFEAGWNVPGEAFAAFIKRSHQMEFAPREGLVGAVWHSMKPAWVADATADPRIKAPNMWHEAGLRSAFYFPVAARSDALGVVSICSDTIAQPDERLLRTAEIIGSQLGHFVQRKRAEVGRREHERRFRQTFELAGSGIAHVSLDGRFLRVNRKLSQILGYSAEELVGRSVKELSHPEDAEVASDQHPLLESDKVDSIHVEKRYLRKDGSVVWVDLTVALARGDTGSPDYEITVMEDITGRKRAERLRGLEHAVNRYLADEGAPSDALRHVMQAICETEDWDTGRYFELDESVGAMRFRESWFRNEDARRWSDASRNFSYRPGEGLVGTAWHTGRPLWVSDMTNDPRVAHPQIAQQTGMRGSFNFPVAFEGRTIGVISITSRSIREPDEPLLQALGVIGRQIGQYLLRRRSEDAGRRFRAALDASADMVFVAEFSTARLLDFNATACHNLGYERAELIGCQANKILADGSLDELLASHRYLLESKDRTDSSVHTYRRKDGSTFEAEVLRRLVESPEGQILVVNARDLTERKAAVERQSAHLRYQEKISRLGQSALGMREPAELIVDAAQSALEGLAADAIAYLEPGPEDGSVVLRDVLGLPEEPSFGVARYASDDPLAAVLQRGEAMVLHDGAHAPLPFDWAYGARSAALVPVRRDGAPRGAFCALSRRPQSFGPDEVRFIEAAASVLSAGLQRIDSESRLAFLAQFDALTGLPNRSLLSDRFSQMIVQAQRRGAQLGVLFIDLDDFKIVNDTLGHAGGDELLKEVASRLKASVRAGDTVARISGDEFAIVLADLTRPEDAAIVAQKIIDALAVPIQVRGQEVLASASTGIAVYPADGEDAESLLGAADAAMYRAKESQRNAYQFFTAEINQRSRARAQLGSELRRALERHEFRLVYQPKIDLSCGRACGAEALLRWNHPDRGLVPPAEFIPVLEETGLIVAVGEWVLRRACEDLKAWTASGHSPLPVAVNLSARQFRQPDLDARIRGVIDAAGVDPGLIELEITESQLMHDPDQAIRVLHTLRDAGIRIAIDDFGTGYSSLAYLTRFPLAALKIDRSFVADVLSDEADATIVRTIVDMAKTLGFTVVAEGVETEAQAAFLRALGCEQAQGYFFAKPMSAAELAAFVAAIGAGAPSAAPT